MAAATHQGQTPYYFVPAPSRHPVMAAIGLFFIVHGAGQWDIGHGWGAYSLFGGLLWLAFVLQAWYPKDLKPESDRLLGERHSTGNQESRMAEGAREKWLG